MWCSSIGTIHMKKLLRPIEQLKNSQGLVSLSDIKNVGPVGDVNKVLVGVEQQREREGFQCIVTCCARSLEQFTSETPETYNY